MRIPKQYDDYGARSLRGRAFSASAWARPVAASRQISDFSSSVRGLGCRVRVLGSGDSGIFALFSAHCDDHSTGRSDQLCQHRRDPQERPDCRCPQLPRQLTLRRTRSLGATGVQTHILVEDAGKSRRQIFVDLGCRGVDHENPNVEIILSGKRAHRSANQVLDLTFHGW